MITIKLFIKKLLVEKRVPAIMLEDPRMYSKLKIYALERIKHLILNILSERAHKNRLPNHVAKCLREQINTVDYLGFNVLDYCVIAGLEDLAFEFCKIGAKNTVNLLEIKSTLDNDQFSELQDTNIIDEILSTVARVQLEQQQYQLQDSARLSGFNSPVLNSSNWEHLKNNVRNFAIKKYKFSLFMLIVGIGCIIAAPFTSGTSLGVVLSLGLPTIMAGVKSLQSTAAKIDAELIEQQSDHETMETALLKNMLTDMDLEINMFKTNGEITDPTPAAVNLMVKQNSQAMLFNSSLEHDTKILLDNTAKLAVAAIKHS